MRPVPLIRTASILTLILFAGHTIGSPWTPYQDGPAVALIRGMKSLHFPIIGFSRSYWDFYQGFGLTISVMLLMFAAWLWQVAGVAKQRPEVAKPLLGTSLVGFSAIAILDGFYFFAIPLALSTAIAVSLALAWASAGPARPR